MVRRCICILFAEIQSQVGCLPAAEITNMITPLNSQPIDQAMVEAAIKRMEKYGSYYRSLEKALGAGASLALGNNVSEDV